MTLTQHANKVCSQNGEDGIIQHLLSIVGEGAKTCLEIGFGSECNTLNLVANKGWHGTFIDQEPLEILKAKIRFQNRLDVKVIQASVTKDNIQEILDKNKVPEKIDVLSIDVDGIDYYVWSTICNVAKIVVIEYNASFGPEKSVTVKYNDKFNRHKIHPLYHGASLQALTRLAESKGMKLVGVDGCGINAFYITKDANTPSVPVEKAFMNHSKRNGTWRDQLPMIEKYGLMEV
jgi:hypothetical protein